MFCWEIDILPKSSASETWFHRFFKIQQGSRGKRTSGLRGGRQMNNTDIKPQTPLALTKPSSVTSIHGSTTIQDFVFRTQIILTDFNTNVLDLVSDLRNIAKQSCYWRYLVYLLQARMDLNNITISLISVPILRDLCTSYGRLNIAVLQ